MFAGLSLASSHPLEPSMMGHWEVRMAAENRRFARRKTATEAAGRRRRQVYDARVRLQKTSARRAGPSFLLAVALALSGLESNRPTNERGDCGQSVVQQSALRDQLLPAGDAKPCIRKPAHIGSAKLVGTDATCPGSDRGQAETAFLTIAGLSAHFCPGSGGGRAPPAAV